MLIPFGNEPIDHYLVAFDKSIGLPANEIIGFINNFPLTVRFLEVVYRITMDQMLFVVIYWGVYRRKSERIWEAVSLFIWGTTFGLISLIIFPATGPFDYYGLNQSESQLAFLQTFDALRTGEPFLVAEGCGMITFPSFHVFMSLIIIWVFRDQSLIRIPVIALNVMIIISTVATGWHYIADVLASIVFFVACVYLGQKLTQSVENPISHSILTDWQFKELWNKHK